MGKAFKISNKNIAADWGYMESWSEGTSSAPDKWVLAGSGASVARSGTKKFGSYSAAVTRSGNDVTLSLNLVSLSGEEIGYWQRRTVVFGAWVKCSSASTARIRVSDGTGNSGSSYHTGGGDWEFLSGTRAISSSASELTVQCFVANNDVTVNFDGVIVCEHPEDLFTDLSDYIEEFSPSIKYKNTTYEMARRKGIYLPGVKPISQTIRIRGNVGESSASLAQAAYDAILKAFDNGLKDLFLNDTRFIQGYLTGESHKYEASMNMIKFDFRFLCPDPYFKYIGRLRDKQDPAASPEENGITVSGDQPTRPVITFTADGGDVTSLTFENQTSGQSFSFTGTISDGDDLVVDCENFTVENDGTSEIENFTGEFLELLPGTNYLNFTGTTSILIYVDYYPKYLAP